MNTMPRLMMAFRLNSGAKWKGAGSWTHAAEPTSVKWIMPMAMAAR